MSLILFLPTSRTHTSYHLCRCEQEERINKEWKQQVNKTYKARCPLCYGWFVTAIVDNNQGQVEKYRCIACGNLFLPSEASPQNMWQQLRQIYDSMKALLWGSPPEYRLVQNHED